MLDRLLNTDNWIFRNLVCYYHIDNEGVSIIESSVSISDKLK